MADEAPRRPSPYVCTGCGLSVAVVGEDVIRACSCDAPIAASMEATAKGTGGVKVG